MTDSTIERRKPIGTEAADPSAVLRRLATASPTQEDEEQISILIVDDEPRNLTVLETVLASPGYRLVRAGSAEEALLALLANEFAVLILDISMPGVTGFELAQMIKGRKKSSQIPIIFLTAYFNEDQHVLEGYESGAVDYLRKPVNPGILRSKVAVLAELHRKQRELERTNRALVTEIAERRHVQEQLRDLNETLERRVLERTEALRESAVLLKAAADNASVGLVIIDRDHRYKFANPAYARMLGLSGSIIGKTPAECQSPAYYQQIAPQLEKALSGERVTFELALPSGGENAVKMNYYSAVYEPDRDDAGHVTGVVAVVIDITAHKQTEQHIQLLMNEVNHRSKNLLSVVMAVARQTASSNPQDFSSRFSTRLRALAVNQDLLVKSQWKSVDLSELASGQVFHLGELGDDRIALDGPRLQISASAAETIGMVLHELSTNAAKYGALSDAHGRVEISWRIGSKDGVENEFEICWMERGGPPVVAPTRRGFGSTVITQMAEMKLDAQTDLDYAEAGFSWRLTCRATSVVADAKV